MVDTSLIKACLKQDKNAYQQFYETCLPYVLTIIRRYGYLKHQEADMVQDIYIQIFTNLDKYDERKGSFKPWMRSITVFTILKDLRKNKISFTKPLEEVIESAFHSIDFSSSDTEYILNEISKLSPGYRAVFNMYAIDGFSHKEIAETLSISVQTSKSQLSRAKNLLRKKLSRHYVINLL